MSETPLSSQIVGIAKPWKVSGVQVSLADDDVAVTVAHGGGPLVCRQCNPRCPSDDKRVRRWRPLDTGQLKTVRVAEVPWQRTGRPAAGVNAMSGCRKRSNPAWHGECAPGLVARLAIRATREALADADNRIAVDRFPVAPYRGQAVDQGRGQEHRRLPGQGDARMTGTQYPQRRLTWMARSRLKPMQQTAKTRRTQLWGILNAVLLGVDNRHAASMNSRIKTVKTHARDSETNKASATRFTSGGLELYPDGIKV